MRGGCSSMCLVVSGVVLAMGNVCAAQIDAGYVGPDGGSYSVPANWDIGVVPINAGGTTYNVLVPGGTRVAFDLIGSFQIDSLNLPAGATLALGASGALDTLAPVTIAGTIEAIGAGSALSMTDPGDAIDDAAFDVADGGTITSAAGAYGSIGLGTRVMFMAEDPGSVLDLGSLGSMAVDPDSGSSIDLFRVVARNGGRIDLSGLATIQGPIADPDRDLLDIEANGAGATIDLSGLSVLDGPVRITADRGGIVSLGPVQPADLRELTIGLGGMIDMPGLWSLRGTKVRLTDDYTLFTAPITDIDDARFFIGSGAQFSVSATSYVSVGQGSAEMFAADRAFTVLDLTLLQTLSVDPSDGPEADWFRILARQGGIVDLSGLRSISGPTTDAGHDRLHLGATGVDSLIDLSGLESIEGPVQWEARDGGRIVSGTDMLTPEPGVWAIVNGGRVDVAGHVMFETTTADLTDGVIAMIGPGTRLLEVGGEDVGLPGDISGNLRLGRLEVGSVAQPARVELRDCFDNGRRGPAGEPEALYLAGVSGGTGLLIPTGSTLVLNDLDTYLFNGSVWIHLNALFGAGVNCVAFGQGTLCLSACRGDLSGDGRVDVGDFFAFVTLFESGDLLGDLTCDGRVDVGDFFAFVAAFDAGCP